MLTTEDEAKFKRCQEGYAASDGVTSGAVTTSAMAPASVISVSSYGSACGAAPVQMPTAPLNCIGSACMAWRWAGWIDPQHPTGHVYEREDKRATTHVGYCGKAGRP